MRSKSRGMMCESIRKKSKVFFKQEISQEELRLYPYLDYVVKNGGHLDKSKLNEYEKSLICKYQELGLLLIDFLGRIKINRSFYDYIQDILADGYVHFIDDKVNYYE